MASVEYRPKDRYGFEVALVTSRSNSVRLTQLPGGAVASLDGEPTLLANPALTADLGAYGVHEQRARRARAEEKVKSHRRQARKHRERAEAIAEMVEAGSSSREPGWCSACFENANHVKVNGMRWPTYLCGLCGAPTTWCAVPGCRHFANRGIRAVSTPRYCAEHRHDIPSFRKMAQRLPALDDYAEWLEFDAVNGGAVTKIAGSVVVVGICVTPAAFAMAPAVGGALGGLTGLSGAAAASHGLALLGGGSLAAGGYGMAGGAMVVAAAGGALGGTLGGVATAAYVKSDPSFKIERLRDGTGPPVIVINGFLTEATPDWAQWKTPVNLRYLDSPVYRVFWGAKELKDVGVLLGAQGVKHAARRALAQFAKKASKKVGSLPGLGAVLAASDLVANPWSVALTRADMTGAILADIIARTDQDRFVLIGHSLGGRVAVRAAQSLGTRNDAPKIAAIHLLGAAISKGEDWRTLDTAVMDNVWNYHSRNDKVLAAVYRSAQLGKQAVGCVGFGSSFPKIKDRDVSSRVKTHGGYFEAVQFAR